MDGRVQAEIAQCQLDVCEVAKSYYRLTQRRCTLEESAQVLSSLANAAERLMRAEREIQ